MRSVFEAAHRKADQNKQARVVAIAAPPPEEAGPPSAPTQGSEFTYHRVMGGELVSKPVFLFYDRSAEKLGTMYWYDVGKRESVPGQSIPLHKVGDGYLGKHASCKDAPGAANIRTARCLTLASRAATVHLEAKSAEHRSVTIQAVKEIFTIAGKKVEDPKEVPKDVHRVRIDRGRSCIFRRTESLPRPA
jgi:hypothetical protein